MGEMIVAVIFAVYAIGAWRIAELCAAQASSYPDWSEPNFWVPALASIIGWPILLLIAWGRTTWAFFKEGVW